VTLSATLRRHLADSALVAAIIVEVIIFAGVAPGFFSVANLVNIALSIAITGILAVGMTMVILTGGIDLSVGSVVALSGIAAAALAARGAPWSGVLAGIGVGIAVGVFDGALVARLRVPSFIVTLAMLTIARGLAFIASDGRSIGNLPPAFDVLGRAAVVGVPVPVITMALVMLGGWFVLARTVFGRHVYAVGGNEEAAWLAGVDVRRTTWLVYAINGALVGLAGVTLASRLGAGVPNAGLQYELDVIAAVVVGGTSLLGGRGGIAGTLWGTVFIGVLGNGLNLANVDPYVQKIAVGVVILAAVMMDRLLSGKEKSG
jgi:ribose/xylose/arabinose/galactoside ABC-type transport system permease subunit